MEPILPGSYEGRVKLACWKAFQAEEDAVYCTCGSRDNCTGYIKSRCCNWDLSLPAVAAKDSNFCERTAEVITDLSERRKLNLKDFLQKIERKQIASTLSDNMTQLQVPNPELPSPEPVAIITRWSHLLILIRQPEAHWFLQQTYIFLNTYFLFTSFSKNLNNVLLWKHAVMSPLEGKWTKLYYLDIKLTYLRLCDNEVK